MTNVHKRKLCSAILETIEKGEKALEITGMLFERGHPRSRDEADEYTRLTSAFPPVNYGSLSKIAYSDEEDDLYNVSNILSAMDEIKNRLIVVRVLFCDWVKYLFYPHDTDDYVVSVSLLSGLAVQRNLLQYWIQILRSKYENATNLWENDI